MIYDVPEFSKGSFHNFQGKNRKLSLAGGCLENVNAGPAEINCFKTKGFITFAFQIHNCYGSITHALILSL